MAEEFINVASGTTVDGAKVATDSISGVHYQKVKLVHGDDGSSAGDVSTSNGLPVSLNSAVHDAFGRLRVSDPTTLFDSQNQYDKGRIFWEEDLEGSATSVHTTNTADVTLTVTASASDKAVRQTREYFRYQPGKSQNAMITFNLGAASAGVDKKVGYFDDENGIFLEQNGTTTLNIVRRTKGSGSAVDNKVAQASWNVDPMDGSGPSGITLDISKTQILFIDMEWLGVGRVRVGFVIDGAIYYVHEFLNANNLTEVYMSTANLPVRYEIDTDGTSGDSMSCICCCVTSEGGFEKNRGASFSAGNDSARTVGADLTPVVSIRPKALFDDEINRAGIFPKSFGVSNANQQGYIALIYGATLITPSWSDVNDDSVVEYDVSATGLTGGIEIARFPIDKQGSASIPSEYKYPLSLSITGAHPTGPYTDSLSVCVQYGGNSATFAGLNWTEHR